MNKTFKSLKSLFKNPEKISDLDILLDLNLDKEADFNRIPKLNMDDVLKMKDKARKQGKTDEDIEKIKEIGFIGMDKKNFPNSSYIELYNKHLNRINKREILKRDIENEISNAGIDVITRKMEELEPKIKVKSLQKRATRLSGGRKTHKKSNNRKTRKQKRKN